ncbi:MAG: hypothetical protein ACK5V3_00425 [Bdellovibrionales bacterium]
MKKYLKILICIAFLSSEVSFARFSKSRARRAGNEIGTTLGSNISTSAQQGQGTQTAAYTSIEQASVDNMNNSQKGQKVAYVLAGGLAGAAARYFGVCSGSFFTGYAACVAAGILAGLALQSRKSGRSFNGPITDSWNNVCTYSSNGCNGSMPNPYAAVVNDNETEAALQKAKQLAKNHGIQIDPNSGIVRTSDGKVIDTSDPSSMSAALGGEEFGKLMAEVKGLEDAALKKVEQVKATAADYGVGGGASISIGEAGYDDETGVGVAGAAGLGTGKNARKPAQVSGLTKNFNGDPIGVAGDSIFMMMSRRYKLKSNQKTFFGPEVQ